MAEAILSAAVAVDAVDVELLFYPQVAVLEAALRRQPLQQRKFVAQGQKCPKGAEVAAPEAVVEQCPDQHGRQDTGHVGAMAETVLGPGDRIIVKTILARDEARAVEVVHSDLNAIILCDPALPEARSPSDAEAVNAR